MTHVYVASSAKNPSAAPLIHLLQRTGYQVLDWTTASEPEEWVKWARSTEASEKWTTDQHIRFMGDPQMLDIARRDFGELQRAELGIIVLPAGRSAHLELGYLQGRGVRTAAYFAHAGIQPEPMLLGVEFYTNRLPELLRWIADPKAVGVEPVRL